MPDNCLERQMTFVYSFVGFTISQNRKKVKKSGTKNASTERSTLAIWIAMGYNKEKSSALL
jgi:hypothetical protein